MTGRRRPLRERLEAAWWLHTDAAALLELGVLARDPSRAVREAARWSGRVHG